MGGSVCVKSKVGRGTTFCISIKLMCKADVRFSSNSSPIRSSSMYSSRNQEHNINPMSNSHVEKPKLLLVNDQIIVLSNLRSRLANTFAVTTADNGFLALQKVQAHPPCYFDVILMDLNMPIMDGFESADKINNYLYG